ncbi:hypothetical protein ACQ4PT_007861 [Festuca glaucescens]
MEVVLASVERMAVRERGEVPRWIKTDYWYGIDEDWPNKCGCGLSPRQHVAYEGIETGRKFMGCHYKTPMCTFLWWVDKQNSAPVCRTLVSMWRMAEKKEIKVTEEEFQKAPEEARQENREQVNAIKSTCEAAAETLKPI